MYVASFTPIGQNPKEDFEKVSFPGFAVLRKKLQGGCGHGLAKLFSSIQGIWGYEISYGVGVIGKNVFAKVIVPPAGGYMYFLCLRYV